MKYSAEAFSLAGDKYLGTPYEKLDCQAFVERMMADVGYKRDLGGSNSWYRECVKTGWAGMPEECVRLFGSVPAGALLFIREEVSASTPARFREDGLGDISHMGVKTCRGEGAIHSSRSRGCVCASAFRDRTVPHGGWNRVGLLPAFSYGNPIDWILEHGGAGEHEQDMREGKGTDGAGRDAGPALNSGKEGMILKGIVTAPSGSTVKLRKEPSTSCSLYWDIPVGSALQVVDTRGGWSKCVCGGLAGWMMSEFIRMEEQQAGPGALSGDGTVSGVGGDPVSADSGVDFPETPPGPGEALPDPPEAESPDTELSHRLSALLAEIHSVLRELCGRIEDAIGRG